VVAIDGWDWSYHLSLNQGWQAVDTYHEFPHVHVRGRLLHPKGLRMDRIDLTFLPTVDMNTEPGSALRPLWVGTLNARGTRSRASFSSPRMLCR
jgi:hypothetical protein